jgi:hypothetical protein
LILVFSAAAISSPAKHRVKTVGLLETSMLLGNFSLDVDSSDYNSGRLRATLSFIPLSSRSLQDSQRQVEIEFVDSEVKLLGHSSIPSGLGLELQPVNPSDPQKYVIKNIPVKPVSALAPLMAASRGGIEIDQYAGIADIYNEALGGDPKPAYIQLEYEISGAIVSKEQMPDKYFNWFPMDKSTLRLPFNVTGATSIISRIGVETPRDLHSKVWQAGIQQLESSLQRTDARANKYILTPKEDKFILIGPESRVVLNGDYQRNLPGRVFFTLAIAMAGGIIGFFVGLFPSTWRALCQSIAITVGTIFSAFIAIVSSNKDIISVVSLRGQISLFDIFALLGLISLMGTAILVFKCKECSQTQGQWATKKNYQISTIAFTGFVSFILPLILFLFVHP